MKSVYDIQNGVRVEIELGVVRACLYEAGKVIRRSTHQVRVRDDLVVDSLRETSHAVRNTCDSVTRGADIKTIVVRVHTPLSFFIEDHFSYATKKDIPQTQLFVQEIEVTLPTYITNILGTHAQDGVLVQHVPHTYMVRGFEVPKDTRVLGPYDVVQTLQWVTRFVYEAVRELKNTYTNATVVYEYPTPHDVSEVVIGGYMSRLVCVNKINDLPIGIGESSLLRSMSEEYNVPEAVIKSALRANEELFIKKDRYTTYAVREIRDALEKVLRFTNMHSYQSAVDVHAPHYLESIVRVAIKPFTHRLSTMKIDQE